MIVEWFVGFMRGLWDGFVEWMNNCTETVEAICGTPELPDISPFFAWLATLDFASAGVVGETFTAIGVFLCVFLLLFLFALIRQLWKTIPLIGGG